jgi:hypothetical protein
VKLKVTSGKGVWQSGVFKAKVNIGLPVDLILGMSFLLSHHIVIDTLARSAHDKRVGYDLIKPRIPKQLSSLDSPPTSQTDTIPAPYAQSSEKVSEPPLAGYLQPAPIMAAVREQIETIALQETLTRRDKELKRTFSELFPIKLPNAADIPTHIYHRIRLKDPSKVITGRGYSAPKKFHDAWKTLLEEHLAAGRIRPSSSEFASPSFCVPKYRDGIPVFDIPPRWVNDYRELNKNTICDHFPLPRIDDILADCGRGKIFGKLDMTNSFFQT